MAKNRKHRRHMKGHRRHMKGFGDLIPNLKQSVKLSSPLVGIAAGLGVGLGLKALSSSTSLLQSLPTALQNNLVPLGAVVAGGGLYLLRKKKDHGAAIGNAMGAVAAAAVVLTFDYLTTNSPQLFSGVVEVSLANGLRAKAMKGLLFANPGNPNRFNGVLVRNPRMQGMRGHLHGLLIPNAQNGRQPRDVSAYVGAGGTAYDPAAGSGGETDYEDENAP